MAIIAADKPLIRARNVGLEIRTIRTPPGAIGSSIAAILRTSLSSSSSAYKRKILNDLDFEIMPGDRIGLIGPNGAGKTTLLLMLNGALRHTSGQLEVNGETHALMNVWFGMKPRATGIENIYLNGYRLGYRTRDIRALVDDITDFSELGEQIRESVATYSAGMQLRLAFGIATAIKPDILLMDEWIGAGDQKFRHKAGDRIKKVTESSRGLVIASHNEGLIRLLCNKVLYLEKGRIQFFGGIDEGYKLFNKAETSA